MCRHIINEIYNRLRLRRKGIDHVPGTPSGTSVQNTSRARHLITSLPIFAVSVGISLATQDLGSAMSLTGNVAAVTLAFILPPLCALAHFARSASQEQSITYGTIMKANPGACLLLVFGASAMVLCTSVTIYGIVHPE